MSRLAVLAFLMATPALAAGPFESDWAISAKSRARLIADAGGAALEIELAPGAITYWRDPGEAGVPPTFDFSKSQNLARAEVMFPPPQRIAEPDGSEAFGYRAGAVLPIAVIPADAGKPVHLVAHVDYGVCEKVCLPAKADVALTLPAPVASPFAEALAKARVETPEPVAPSALGAEVQGAGNAWRLCLAQAPRDLFVEAPEGYWIAPKREADGRCYALSLRQAPEGAKPPISVRVTVEGGARAVETRLDLPG